ncbi:vWA domain-containing protein [Polyangium mundeleinium]|uniref:VWA domain-containing protein n=1 Tax=Polyangium mundeleinium TaxID=2995306 RepID=A0ABT5EIF1_9BACT|nr:VWA domain-containing protein [Polyangium mundeleinium]MDC0741583.1 VWA domain-containing protein [Polyangium mundeleinium]
MTSELVRYVDFQDNPEPRCHFVLLVDTSGSMQGPKIDMVNYGLEMLRTDLCDHDKARNAVELTVVKFGATVEPLVTFSRPDAFAPPKLVAGGRTYLAAAIHCGLDLIERRRETYRQAGVLYYAPWLWCITDGRPTDYNDIPAAVTRVQQTARDPATGKTRVDLFMVGVETPDDPVDLKILRQLSPQREPLMLRGIHAFQGMFNWISQSLIAVSQSNPGAQVSMPRVDGWGTVG